jgi:hypothetical protein
MRNYRTYLIMTFKFQRHNISLSIHRKGMITYLILWSIEIPHCQMSFSDVLDSDHLPTIFHILDRVSARLTTRKLALSEINNELPGLNLLLQHRQRPRKLQHETWDPACKMAVNPVTKTIRRMTRKKAFERRDTNISNCQAIWPIVKSLRRGTDQGHQSIHGLLGLKFPPPLYKKLPIHVFQAEHRIKFRPRPMRFLDFSNHEKGAPRQGISKWSTVCSTFSTRGWSVVRSASLAKGGTSKKIPSPHLHQVPTRSNKVSPRTLQTALVCKRSPPRPFEPLILFILVWKVSERLSANINLTLHKAPMRSIMTYACLAWKFAAGIYLLKLQRLRNKSFPHHW